MVTDPRFPGIWDQNYARVESGDPTLSLEEVEAATLPRLLEAGAPRFHVVMFRPGGTTRLLAELSSRGDALSWDAALEQTTRPVLRPGTATELTDLDDAFWSRYRASLPAFGPVDEAAAQLEELERTVFLGLGKRWFGVRDGGELLALGSLLVLERVAYLDHVVTFPEARRRGYAAAVTATMAEAGRGAGAERVMLLADLHAAGPRALYRGLGFELAGTIASTRRLISAEEHAPSPSRGAGPAR